MKKFVERNLYVDDALTSLPSAKGAIDLARRTQQALSAGGNLKLHTVVSNSSEDMAFFPRIYRQRSERTRFRLLFRFFTKISWNELEYPERRSHFLRDKAQHYGN